MGRAAGGRAGVAGDALAVGVAGGADGVADVAGGRVDDADGLADDDATALAGEAAEDVARGDGELTAVAAAFGRGPAADASFVALHPQTTIAAPRIQTGISRTRTMHLAQSSDIRL